MIISAFSLPGVLLVSVSVLFTCFLKLNDKYMF